jgi:hypothetical protein
MALPFTRICSTLKFIERQVFLMLPHPLLGRSFEVSYRLFLIERSKEFPDGLRRILRPEVGIVDAAEVEVLFVRTEDDAVVAVAWAGSNGTPVLRHTGERV